MADVVSMNDLLRRRIRSRKLDNPKTADEVNRFVRGQDPKPPSVALEDEDLERLATVRRDDAAAFAGLHPEVRQAVISYEKSRDDGSVA